MRRSRSAAHVAVRVTRSRAKRWKRSLRRARRQGGRETLRERAGVGTRERTCRRVSERPARNREDREDAWRHASAQVVFGSGATVRGVGSGALTKCCRRSGLSGQKVALLRSNRLVSAAGRPALSQSRSERVWL